MVPRVLQQVFALVQVLAHRRLDVDEAAFPGDVALGQRLEDAERERRRADPTA
jgi:hypothetical protein